MLRTVILALGLLAGGAQAAERLPLFDAHLHYNWEPKPYFTLDEVFKLFKENGVTGILATSRPNDGTRALYEAPQKEVWVVPFIRPYNIRADIQTWFNDPKIYELIEREYQRGYYRGIGEFHLSGSSDAGTAWVKKAVDFAVDNNLYLHAHADDAALEQLYANNPKAKIIWAHTGFSTSPEKVAAYLERYPNLWCELSYRYGITEGDGKLNAAWRQLFTKYPDRFLIGSDTWINQRWASYSQLMDEYRGWLKQLPPDVAEKIAFRNAERLFRR